MSARVAEFEYETRNGLTTATCQDCGWDTKNWDWSSAASHAGRHTCATPGRAQRVRRVKAAGQLLGMMMVIGVCATLLRATDSISKSWSAIDSNILSPLDTLPMWAAVAAGILTAGAALFVMASVLVLVALAIDWEVQQWMSPRSRRMYNLPRY